jgi:hypothetical protein
MGYPMRHHKGLLRSGVISPGVGTSILSAIAMLANKIEVRSELTFRQIPVAYDYLTFRLSTKTSMAQAARVIRIIIIER